MKVSIPSLIFLLLLLQNISFAWPDEKSPREKERASSLKVISEAAAKKDLTFLQEYGKSQKAKLQQDKIINLGYHLALYTIDPAKYEEAYVKAFPTNSETIFEAFMYFELDHSNDKTNPYDMPGSSYDALKEIALKGNRGAIRKVLNATANSDGAPAEMLADIGCNVLEKQTQRTVEQMAASLPYEKRSSLYTWFVISFDWD